MTNSKIKRFINYIKLYILLFPQPDENTNKMTLITITMVSVCTNVSTKVNHYSITHMPGGATPRSATESPPTPPWPTPAAGPQSTGSSS